MDAIYQNDINRDVRPAQEGEFEPLALGPLRIWPPVVLAPMAGVTNYPFRALCRNYGAGLYVSEMITARGIVNDHPKTLRLAGFGADETPRSLQLYGTDPASLGEAARRLVSEGKVDHIDMNFGCPVRKVTSRGGGSAIPLKPKLMRRLVGAVVQGAGDVPVTIKFRMGVDEDHMTFRDAGRIGEDEGCVAVGMHARTAAMLYGGEARWEAIGELKQMLSIPVLGNGDIWEAQDALRMMRQTDCDGVIVGRGCLGRPWLFRDLADVFDGREPSNPPTFGEVVDIMIQHAELVCAWTAEGPGMRMMRKFCSWYTKSFPGGAKLRPALMLVNSVDDLRAVLADVDRDTPFPPDGMRVKRGKTSRQQTVSLPDGYLDELDDDTPPEPGAEVLVSGG
ncbi:MAG: tRNA dihydrouridine synthase DusB [Planctomycetota bacterium]|nr:tRNA dihydrouridine synthase DusB [Planctomycetota bacterium]